MSQNNLPVPPASLVGRSAELAAIREQLLDDGARLLTLTGTAGTGKTRLAVASAVQLANAFGDGVWFVDLAPLNQAADVLPAIAGVLGVRSAGNELSVADNLRLYLSNRHLLLVLDNCEHVLEAAPGIGGLLDACPHLVVLATSREPLRLRHERLQPVNPLRTPALNAAADVDALLDVPSVELFVQRARHVQPTFQLTADNAATVAELCRELDGLPLALELAAARSRALPPEAMLARLESRFDMLKGGRRDDPARHQTLRAALAWSHDLLGPAEQTVFRRLAVFVGGCDLDAAEAVCDPDGSLGAAALDILESLLDKSLLKQEETSGEPRFGMLETMRAYALESLEASGEAESVRQCHVAHFATAVQTAANELRGPHQMAWLEKLDRELANIRASLRYLMLRAEAGDAAATEQGLRLGAQMWWYMHVRGTYAETREWLRPLLRASESAAPSAARGRALDAAGVAAWGLGEYETALGLARESLDVAESVGDPAGACQALIDLTCDSLSLGDIPSARQTAAEALRRAQDMGDEWSTGWALTFRGMLDIAEGDEHAAAKSFEAALRLRQRLGDLFGEAWASNGLASVAMLRGEPAVAEPLYELALGIFRRLGERPTVATILDGLGQAALTRGDLELARERFAASLSLYREMDSRRGIGIALHGLARVAAAEGRPESAVRLAGAATALHEAGGGAIELIRQEGSDAWLADARRKLGEPAASVAWTDGRGLSVETATAEALAGVARRGTAPRTPGMPLTAREREVARLVAQGASNRQIAETLVIGERTAEAHVSNMLAKLGLTTRVQLAAWAVARGLAADAQPTQVLRTGA
jgi:predicted ATPase/DNA-binding CsgD family transcriptional regulator